MSGTASMQNAATRQTAGMREKKAQVMVMRVGSNILTLVGLRKIGYYYWCVDGPASSIVTSDRDTDLSLFCTFGDVTAQLISRFLSDQLASSPGPAICREHFAVPVSPLQAPRHARGSQGTSDELAERHECTERQDLFCPLPACLLCFSLDNDQVGAVRASYRPSVPPSSFFHSESTPSPPSGFRVRCRTGQGR